MEVPFPADSFDKEYYLPSVPFHLYPPAWAVVDAFVSVLSLLMLLWAPSVDTMLLLFKLPARLSMAVWPSDR